ncbi:MAG: A24 family peptidase [Pseudomonadota bacterium]
MDLLFMIAGAGAIGGGLAWLRPELDLAPLRTALWSCVIACLPAAPALAGLGQTGGGVLILFAALAALSVIDAQRHVLPNEVTLPLIAIGLIAGIAVGTAPGLDRLIGAGLAYGLFRLIGEMWIKWRGEDGLGLGDAKLFAGIGAFFGWQALAEVVLAASLATTALLLIRRREGTAFGPGLAFGALVWWAVGPLLA